jgi:hypothetical protein
MREMREMKQINFPHFLLITLLIAPLPRFSAQH